MEGVPLAESFRATDPDRYISILYAPAEKRAALAALYAFDAEIAGIRARIREPLPGEIRLQWWRDALAAGNATGNPLADALIDAIRLHHLPLPAFDAYLEARIFDLYDDPMPSRNDLEGYLGETEGAVIQLAALVLDREAATRHAALAGHAGCARGIAGALRRLGRGSARSKALVPLDLLAAAGLTADSFRAGEGEAQAADALAAPGREHARAFLAEAKALPAPLRPAYLPLASIPEGLVSGAAQPASWKLQWLSLKAAMGFWPRG